MKIINGKMVTGAGSGLGRTIAEYLAKKGASVVIVDINLTSANDNLNRIEKKGDRGLVLKVDVGNAEAVNKMISVTNNKYGRIDFLFNNAGADIRLSKELGVLEFL